MCHREQKTLRCFQCPWPLQWHGTGYVIYSQMRLVGSPYSMKAVPMAGLGFKNYWTHTHTDEWTMLDYPKLNPSNSPPTNTRTNKNKTQSLPCHDSRYPLSSLSIPQPYKIPVCVCENYWQICVRCMCVGGEGYTHRHLITAYAVPSPCLSLDFKEKHN